MPLQIHLLSKPDLSLHYGKRLGDAKSPGKIGALLKLQKRPASRRKDSRQALAGIMLVGAGVCATGTAVPCVLACCCN